MYALRMNSRLVVRFFVAVASGVLLGELIQLDQAKWHRLGREAFLSNQAFRFDRDIANPSNGVALIVFCVIAVVGLATLFEVATYGGVKLLSLLSRGKAQGTENS